MKYHFDQKLDKGEILAGYRLVKTSVGGEEKNGKVIVAEYLDGTEDVHKLDESTIGALDNKLEQQAKAYIKNANKKIKTLKLKSKFKILLSAAIAGAVGFSHIKNFSLGDKYLDLFVASILASYAVVNACSAVVDVKQAKDLDKYATYSAHQKELAQDYPEINKTEQSLGAKREKNELIGISWNSLDSYNCNDLEKRLIKGKRYKEITG